MSEMWRLAMDSLAKGWTFEQIHGRCKRDDIPVDAHVDDLTKKTAQAIRKKAELCRQKD